MVAGEAPAAEPAAIFSAADLVSVEPEEAISMSTKTGGNELQPQPLGQENETHQEGTVGGATIPQPLAIKDTSDIDTTSNSASAGVVEEKPEQQTMKPQDSAGPAGLPSPGQNDATVPAATEEPLPAATEAEPIPAATEEQILAATEEPNAADAEQQILVATEEPNAADTKSATAMDETEPMEDGLTPAERAKQAVVGLSEPSKKEKKTRQWQKQRSGQLQKKQLQKQRVMGKKAKPNPTPVNVLPRLRLLKDL